MSFPNVTCPSETREPLRVPSPAGTPAGAVPAEEGDRRQVRHYRRPQERPFLASEVGRTTILIGGLTRRHDQFIRAVFEGAGHKCEILPTPDQGAFHVGKEYGNNGQCSPAYFMSGSLIQFLKHLEAEGLSRQEINERYVFFTAGSCGPCRFGMYAAEYRMALQSAGFGDFRVIRFQQDDGVRQQATQPGLRYTLDFGLGMLKALYLGDVLNDLAHSIRAYEVHPGETDKAFDLCVRDLETHLREYKPAQLSDELPAWVPRDLLGKNGTRSMLEHLHRFRCHLHGEAFSSVLERCRERINSIETDRTRLKPLVKIVGEFWAQTTEGDGNYRIFDFLEREGAQVLPEALGTWVAYLLAHARTLMEPRRGMNSRDEEPDFWDLRQRLLNQWGFQRKQSLLQFGEWLYTREYHHIVEALGGTAHRLVPQRELARLAEPYYATLARGGEGHLEVGKNIYYTANRLCHMVLSLKPFGCLPSSQSDGVQSAVVSRFRDMIFLPIETSGEGEVNAHSRVQMALGEARAKAKVELQNALQRSGTTLQIVQEFVRRHPQLRQALYPVPHRHGVAGTAANFVLHVSDLMAGRAQMSRA